MTKTKTTDKDLQLTNPFDHSEQSIDAFAPTLTPEQMAKMVHHCVKSENNHISDDLVYIWYECNSLNDVIAIVVAYSQLAAESRLEHNQQL